MTTDETLNGAGWPRRLHPKLTARQLVDVYLPAIWSNDGPGACAPLALANGWTMAGTEIDRQQPVKFIERQLMRRHEGSQHTGIVPGNISASSRRPGCPSPGGHP